MRKYEIVVLSKGAFARTLKIYAPRKAERAVIVCDGTDAVDIFIAALESLRIKNTAVIALEGAQSQLDFLPFDPAEGNGEAQAFYEFLSDAAIPYLDKRFGFGFYGVFGAGTSGIAAIHAATKKRNNLEAFAALSAPYFCGGTNLNAFLKDNDFADAFYYIFTNRDLQISADIQDAYQTSAFCVYKRIREFTYNAVFRIDRDNKSAIREFLTEFSKI